jgi:hypothetical protein
MCARQWILRRLISALVTASLRACSWVEEPTPTPLVHAVHAHPPLTRPALAARASLAAGLQPGHQDPREACSSRARRRM